MRTVGPEALRPAARAPRGVAVQSSARMRAPISPPPTKGVARGSGAGIPALQCCTGLSASAATATPDCPAADAARIPDPLSAPAERRRVDGDPRQRWNSRTSRRAAEAMRTKPRVSASRWSSAARREDRSLLPGDHLGEGQLRLEPEGDDAGGRGAGERGEHPGARVRPSVELVPCELELGEDRRLEEVVGLGDVARAGGLESRCRGPPSSRSRRAWTRAENASS